MRTPRVHTFVRSSSWWWLCFVFTKANEVALGDTVTQSTNAAVLAKLVSIFVVTWSYLQLSCAVRVPGSIAITVDVNSNAVSDWYVKMRPETIQKQSTCKSGKFSWLGGLINVKALPTQYDATRWHSACERVKGLIKDTWLDKQKNLLRGQIFTNRINFSHKYNYCTITVSATISTNCGRNGGRYICNHYITRPSVNRKYPGKQIPWTKPFCSEIHPRNHDS